MQIQKAIKSIQEISSGWVSVEQARETPDGLALDFRIRKGRRGALVERWTVICTGVHETQISDLDGGGVAVYKSDHPAARQYRAAHAELRWTITGDEAHAFSELYSAHIDAVDDWIDFDRYLPVRSPWTGKLDGHLFVQETGCKIVCRGPEFLLRTYAKVLKAIGEHTKLTLRPKRKTTTKPKVLHFGTSFVVAESFKASRTET